MYINIENKDGDDDFCLFPQFIWTSKNVLFKLIYTG